MKTGKRIISLLLCAIMVFGMFSGVDFGIESSIFDLESSAAEITLGGITQKRVVSNYESLYAQYQARFFTGTNSNSPTNFVIPGLSSSDDYTPQGMTYWEEKEWILISAYDASGAGKHSVVYAIDAVTTEFVALFKILNANGSVNTSHGGGIAASEYNFYYADTGSNISYFPLSELDVPNGTVKEVRLQGSINCGGELGGAATSYCCYEDGVLWAGNFYYSGDDRYKTKPHSEAESMIVGYELHGNSSEEEWYYLSKGYNYVNLTNSTSSQTSGAMTFTTSYTGGKIMIAGKITTDTAIGEITPTFASMKLTEGKKYIIEFTSNNNLSDMYMFAPNGTHCNVKQSQQTTITPLENGYYHYSMIFTAGIKPAGADSSWPSTQSTNGAYSGTYTIRFDQDNIPAGGRDFIIKDFAVMEYDSNDSFDANPLFEGSGCAGNPTHVILFPGMDKFQYAMVYKGRIYISRSWKRVSGDNHTRELMVGNLDTSSTGTSNLVINGRTRPCYVLSLTNMTRYGGDNGMGDDKLNKMFYMGEALCVMNDNLYMFGEGAAWAYNGKESSKCGEPIDVIWKIDQHALMGEERSREDVALSHYEKVWSLEELNTDDEYIIVYESELTDPVTQKNIIYAIDAFGGYGAKKLPKQDEATQANSGDSMGIVGYSITTYNKSEDGNTLYIEAEDDANRSIRWKINASNIANSQANIRISNTDMYYAKYKNLYFGSRLISMRTDSGKNLNKVKAITYGDGKFYLFYEGEVNYFLWCNDGSNQSYIDIYENYYSTHGKVGYTPAYHGLEEMPGTFHGDGLYYKDDVNSGNLMHQAVDEKYGEFYIYKRVADVYADTYESRVYTDLDAELQRDGTYKINLETYAIGTTQYKVLDKQRPTDFIFVLDTSGSMSTKDSSGYEYHYSGLDLKTAAGDDSNAGDREKSYTFSNSKIYYQHPDDGSYHRIIVETQDAGDQGCDGDGLYIWLYYTYNGKTYWYIPTDRVDPSQGGAFKDTARPASSNTIITAGGNDDDRADNEIYFGVHYVNYAQGSTGCPRLDSMKNAVNGLTYKIANEAAKNNLDHRIAIVQYGSNSSGSWTNMGMYTNTSTSRVGYTGTGTVSADNYKKAFYSASQFGTVRTIINNLSANGDTYVDSGMDMAYNIIKNSDSSYLADGNRSACIIMITDGCPGVGGNESAIANDVANAAIQNAYKAKDAGAYVYTVQMGNNSMSGFDMGTYMDNLSSEFISAQSMTDSGDRNVKEINYRLDVPVGSSFNLDNLVNAMFNSVTSNSRNALMKLNASSLLHAEITDAFDLTNADVAVKFAPAAYDGLDRLYFKDEVAATGVTASYNKAAQTIDVSGYDYSVNHVSRSNVDKKQANKLVVTFTGVVPNVDAELNNTNINNTESTAIYQNAGGMEFKKFPTEHFSLPEYTYVLDFGVNMLDTDVNGTLQSVDFLPQKQETYSTLLNDPVNSNAIIGFSEDKQNLLYSLQPGASDDESKSRGYVLIQRDDGTYDWFRINVVPASNVLYEENSASVSGSGVAWQQNGTSKNSYQSLTSANDVYGHDEVYNNNIGEFSNGSSYNAVVSNTNNRSKTLTFDYTGSAVDIVSACGPQTGIQVISIKNEAGAIEKAYIVDTYYTDTQYLNGQDLLSQVPIVHHENKNGHGTYTVEVTAAYLSSMVNARRSTMSLYSDDTVNFYTPDVKNQAAEAVLSILGMEELLDADVEVLFADENSVLNGGTGATAPAISTFALTREGDRPLDALTNYFDGFRVYNPLGDKSGDYVESEQGATYYNVINSLASSNDIITGSGDNLVAYVEGDTNENIKFADYAKSNAPLNEVYLKKQENSAVSFNVQTSADTKIMISLRAVSGSPVAKIGDEKIPVNSSTEMYYNITDYVDNDGLVTIQNDGDGLLAVCNIKVVNGGIMPMMMSALPRMRMMMAMPAEEVIPNQPKVEEPVINPDLIPDSPVENPDPDLDVEGEIPEYIPDTNEPDNSVVAVIDNFIEMMKSFFDRIFAFFKTIFNVMGGK